MNDEDLLEYLNKLTEDLNRLGFNTDRTETFYALYLAVVHRNAVMRDVLSLQIELLINKRKPTFRNQVRSGLLKFVSSRKHLILLPATEKSRLAKILLRRRIRVLEASKVGKDLLK